MPELTQREVLMLRDQLESEKLEIEKFRTYAAQVSDPALKRLLEDIQRTHERHFDVLSRHL